MLLHPLKTLENVHSKSVYYDMLLLKKLPECAAPLYRNAIQLSGVTFTLGCYSCNSKYDVSQVSKENKQTQTNKKITF